MAKRPRDRGTPTAVGKGSDAQKHALARRRKRFVQVIAAAFGSNHLAAAHFLRMAEGSPRHWSDLGEAWPQRAEEHLAKFELTVADLDIDDEEEWQRTIDSVPGRLAEATGKPASGWMYTGGEVEIFERNAGSDRQIILITCDLQNDTQIREVWKMVETNLKKGVDYLYVVPSNAENLTILQRQIENFKRENGDQPDLGGVHVMRVPRDQTVQEWRFIDHVLLRLTKTVDRSSVGSIDLAGVDQCFEQVYRPGDIPGTERIWLKMPPRRLNLYLDLLARWEPISDWE